MSRPVRVEDVRYHRAMARWMERLGFEGLARSHWGAVWDDPVECGCDACRMGKRDRRYVVEVEGG